MVAIPITSSLIHYALIVPSHLKEIRHLHLKGFLNHECEAYLKINDAYRSSNHILAIETGLLAFPISRDSRLCHL